MVRDSTSRDIVVFALVVTVVPPLLLGLVELAAGLVDRRLLRALHLLFVGALVGVLALTVVTKEGAPSGAAAIGAAVVVGAAGALAYDRVRAARSFLTILAPVPLVFVALFLFHSPASKLVLAGQPEARAAPVTAAAARNRTPVVLILFDEFSTVSLMDASARIDRRRYPSFASLARDSTWYRNNTSVDWLSEAAVPSILTGRLPDEKKAPVLADYPENLFTLLGGTRRIQAFESISRLCPPKLCRATRAAQAEVAGGKSGALASDAGIVYLHLLLPDPFVSRFAPIDASWGNFGGGQTRERELASSQTADVPACGRSICEFTDAIMAGGKPALYFLDSSLPHVPYVYLPSGKRYALDSRVLRGNDDGLWLDSWPTTQSQERYLLQTGYTDLALGHILRKLRASELYDKALVIVTADHGVSFNVGDQRRLPTATNLDDIAFVPLLVKLPGQTRGRIDDSLTRSIDILPTVADVVGLKPTWHVDGRSLLRPLPADGTVTVSVQGHSVSAPLSTLRARRSRALARQVATFGTGSFAKAYRIGPNQSLLGRSVAAIPVRQGSTLRVERDGDLLSDVADLESGFVPTYVEGALSSKAGPPVELAVAVNGRIAAVTRSFDQYGKRRFAALFPESALHQGRNAVGVYAVRRGRTGLELDELRSPSRELTLGWQKPIEVISAPGGPTFKVYPESLRGTVHVEPVAGGYVFSGRASARSKAPVHRIAVFAGSSAVFVAPATGLKPGKLLGEAADGPFGYRFELPRSILPAAGSDVRLRVFAIRYGVASELHYDGHYPWLHGPPA